MSDTIVYMVFVYRKLAKPVEATFLVGLFALVPHMAYVGVNNCYLGLVAAACCHTSDVTDLFPKQAVKILTFRHNSN